MKHSPVNNANILNINASTVKLVGNHKQQVSQLLNMFRIAEEKASSGNRKALHINS